MNKRNHICFLGNVRSVHTQRWINYFQSNGWKVDLITWHPPTKDCEIHPDIAIHRTFFPPHYIARYGCLLEISAIMHKIQPDIIHAHYVAHFGILAGIYGQLSGFKPIIQSAWGSDILHDAKGWKKRLIAHSLKQSDLITCDGENSKDAILNLGIDPRKVKIIYHGVDTEDFTPLKRDRSLIRRLFGQEQHPVVISARSLNARGNVETFLKAIPIILEKIPDAKFIIGGSGSEETKLKRIAEELDILNCTRFTGQIPHEQLSTYLASSDVYVSTTLLDGGVAVATLDAMACALPPVVTDVGDNSKWITNGKNGFIIPLRDNVTLAERVIFLLENKKARRDFGEKNRQLIVEKQEYRKNMEQMEQYYKSLLGDS